MSAGKPSNEEDYEQLEDNGVEVYLAKNALVDPEGLEVLFYGTGPWGRLVIKGLHN